MPGNGLPAVLEQVSVVQLNGALAFASCRSGHPDLPVISRQYALEIRRAHHFLWSRSTRLNLHTARPWTPCGPARPCGPGSPFQITVLKILGWASARTRVAGRSQARGRNSHFQRQRGQQRPMRISSIERTIRNQGTRAHRSHYCYQERTR
jgi:hypothetical protein